MNAERPSNAGETWTCTRSLTKVSLQGSASPPPPGIAFTPIFDVIFVSDKNTAYSIRALPSFNISFSQLPVWHPSTVWPFTLQQRGIKEGRTRALLRARDGYLIRCDVFILSGQCAENYNGATHRRWMPPSARPGGLSCLFTNVHPRYVCFVLVMH